MKRLIFFIAAIPLVSAAGETVLYDVDYTRPETYSPDPLPTVLGAYPGRSQCTAIVSGTAVCDEAPPGFSPDTFACAILRSSPPGNFAQIEFSLFAGGVYVFRKHRIEITFQFVNPAALAGFEGLTIFTDGGVTDSLDFQRTGNVMLRSYVPRDPPNPDWQNNTVTASTVAGTFDPTLPVHAVWETDLTNASTSVTVNGTTVSKSGLAEVAYGFRNWALYRGPLGIRLSLGDTGGDCPLAIRSVRIVGSDHDGPQYQSGGGASPLYHETGVKTVPFSVPPAGNWQPQFSENGSSWLSFGGVVNQTNAITEVSFGTLVSPSMFFRLVEIP